MMTPTKTSLSLKQISHRKSAESRGKCAEPRHNLTLLPTAISAEGAESLDSIKSLPRTGQRLWSLAARAMRDMTSTRRPTVPHEEDFPAEIILPDPLKVDALKLLVYDIACPGGWACIDVGPTRRMNYLIARYPDSGRVPS